MRDSREKGAGMRDQDPPSRPCINKAKNLWSFTNILFHETTCQAIHQRPAQSSEEKIRGSNVRLVRV